MADPRVTPVIIGVGDVVNRSLKIEDAVEPLELMFKAAKVALNDTGLSSSQLEKLQSDIDSIDIVATLQSTWRQSTREIARRGSETNQQWTVPSRFSHGWRGSRIV